MASGGAIREAATGLFLARSYAATSMDDIAAAAQVSKQTIYTHFRNKEELFADLVMGNAERVEGFATAIAQTSEAAHLTAGLRALARRYVGFVIMPEVLRLRRLVIGESSRFPALARRYYEAVPGRVVDELASLFTGLAGQGRLRVTDANLAAQHFAWLCLGQELDRGMFIANEPAPTGEDLDRIADSAVAVFLAAYGA
jgi:TetR/AcrR family transcriptional repressor of mexJK operon